VTSPLFIDTYSGAPQPDWQKLVDAGAPWHGAIIKATEGTGFGPKWFDANWKAVREVAGDRYGADWFRGAYHFLKFNQDGAAQADFYLSVIERAGGWGPGDIWPAVDVEMGGEANSNRSATAQQVIDCTSAFAERVRSRTGRDVMLYGNGAMRDLGIKNRMSCSWLWCPRYTATLPREIYERAGWSQDRLALWQYAGDGTGGDNVGLSGYPAAAPGLSSHCDVSVLTLPGGLPALRAQLNGPRLNVLGLVTIIALAFTMVFR
jgi:GH25 family lysozyme M1 (1,4-beta-N-acetylmuramidase)